MSGARQPEPQTTNTIQPSIHGPRPRQEMLTAGIGGVVEPEREEEEDDDDEYNDESRDKRSFYLSPAYFTKIRRVSRD